MLMLTLVTFSSLTSAAWLKALGPDTKWLGNIPFALTLAMLSHALQMLGAMYYLWFKTFEGAEGCLLLQSKCEITKHVTTESAEDWSNGARGGRLERMLDRFAMIVVNQTSECVLLTQTTAGHSCDSPRSLKPWQCFKETEDSSKATVEWGFNGLFEGLQESNQTYRSNNQSLRDSVTFVLFLFNWEEEMSHSSHYPQHHIFNLCAMWEMPGHNWTSQNGST